MTNQDLYEMGWNDVIGNLRRATEATDEQKRLFATKITKGKIRLARHEDRYKEGTVAAATAFLNGQDLPYKGPDNVVADMEAKTS